MLRCEIMLKVIIEEDGVYKEGNRSIISLPHQQVKKELKAKNDTSAYQTVLVARALGDGSQKRGN